MSNEKENDKIDPREWLAKSFEAEFPDAARHTEMTDDKRLVSKFRSPIDALHDNGSLTHDQYRAGCLIIRTRQAINNGLKTDRILHEYSGEEFTPDNAMSPGSLLIAIFRGLKPYQQHMIDRVCLQRQRQDYGYQERPMTDQDKLWVAKCIGTLRESLDDVKKNIDAVIGKN